MASDEDYMAFLDKANQDPMEGYAKTSAAKKGFKTVDDGEKVPKALVDVTKGKFYISDADEPFVPVCLRWDEGGKGLPDEGMSSRFPQPSFALLSAETYETDLLTATPPTTEEFAKLINHPDPSKAKVELQDPMDWNASGDYTDVIEAVRESTQGADVKVYAVRSDGARTEYFVVSCEGEGKKARLVGVKALAVES